MTSSNQTLNRTCIIVSFFISFLLISSTVFMVSLAADEMVIFPVPLLCLATLMQFLTSPLANSGFVTKSGFIPIGNIFKPRFIPWEKFTESHWKKFEPNVVYLKTNMKPDDEIKIDLQKEDVGFVVKNINELLPEAAQIETEDLHERVY